MKRLISVAAIFSALLLCVSGCPKSASTGDSKAKDAPTTKQADQFRQVVEILQASTETSGFREALNVAGSDLARAENQGKARLGAESRDFMRRRLELKDEELADVESTTFRALDSHHVQHCFLLRDAARAIERSGAGPLAQAQQAMAWVDRHVLLIERADNLQPPYWALQLGEGTAQERALVFLAILDQLQIGNCLVSLGEPEDVGLGHVFAGAVIGDDSQKAVYLFDPRLGRAVAGADGACTLGELRKDPQTHLPDRKNKAAAPKVRVHFVVSMQSLSPRMKYLEDRLAVHDRVTLFAAPERLQKNISEATGQEAAPWISSPERAGRSPLRMLAAFLPLDEGGHDNSSRQRRAEMRTLPWMDIQKRYAALGVHDDLVPQAQDMLFHLTKLLFQRYDRDPRLALAGGYLERAAKRLDWGREALDDAEFSLLSDTILQKHAISFREQLKEAYLALVRKQQGGQELVNRAWNRDQYIGTLLLAKDRPDPKLEKTELTFLMLSAVREPLSERVLFLNGLRWQDRAAKSQAVLEEQQKSPKQAKAAKARAAENAASDWLNTQGAWQHYVERAPIAAQLGRLERLRQFTAFDLLAGQHQDLAGMVHRAAAGRLFLATAQLHRNQLDPARNTLKVLSTDLAAVRDSSWQKDLTDLMERIPGSQQLLREIIKGLSDNLGPRGGIFWLQKRVDDLLAVATPKSN